MMTSMNGAKSVVEMALKYLPFSLKNRGCLSLDLEIWTFQSLISFQQIIQTVFWMPYILILWRYCAKNCSIYSLLSTFYRLRQSPTDHSDCLLGAMHTNIVKILCRKLKYLYNTLNICSLRQSPTDHLNCLLVTCVLTL